MRSQSTNKEVTATDTQTIASLFRQYGDDVFRLAYSYLGNRQDAEDVCQTVFLNLAEKSVILLPGKEKSWLLTCAANALKNLHRSFWRKNVTVLEDDISFSDDRHQELHDALMTLPPKYRVVVHLYYFEGYDQGEIAGILRISRTAVQTRMQRARTMLRKELTDYEV